MILENNSTVTITKPSIANVAITKIGIPSVAIKKVEVPSVAIAKVQPADVTVGKFSISTKFKSNYRTELRTNLCKNPNFETGVTGWSRNAVNWQLPTSYTTDAFLGTKCMRGVVNAVSGLIAGQGLYFTANSTYRYPAQVGDTFTVSCYLKTLTGSRNYGIGVFTYNTATTSTRVEPVVTSNIVRVRPPTDSWVRVSDTYTITDANSLFMSPMITTNTAGAIGDSILIDCVLVEKNGELLDYFDGTYTTIDRELNPGLKWGATADDSFSYSTVQASGSLNIEQTITRINEATA
jgi:hypothetical protein